MLALCNFRARVLIPLDAAFVVYMPVFGSDGRADGQT